VSTAFSVGVPTISINPACGGRWKECQGKNTDHSSSFRKAMMQEARHV
jgi:hypothetical protein